MESIKNLIDGAKEFIEGDSKLRRVRFSLTEQEYEELARLDLPKEGYEILLKSFQLASGGSKKYNVTIAKKEFDYNQGASIK